MLVHRFRDFWTAPQGSRMGVSSVENTAFVPCPCPVALGMSAMQQAQVEYLYRLAFEQAQAQVAQSQARDWPAFSLN